MSTTSIVSDVNHRHIRNFIRAVIVETYAARDTVGWHDPDVLFDDDIDDDVEDHDERKNYVIMMKMKNNAYNDSNSRLGTVKPTMPAGPGGAQSNRVPGGTTVSPSRAYSPGH